MMSSSLARSSSRRLQYGQFGSDRIAILRLPLSAIVIASLLTGQAGPGAEPLTIVAVVVAYLVTLRLSALQSTTSSAPATTAKPHAVLESRPAA